MAEISLPYPRDVHQIRWKRPRLPVNLIVLVQSSNPPFVPFLPFLLSIRASSHQNHVRIGVDLSFKIVWTLRIFPRDPFFFFLKGRKRFWTIGRHLVSSRPRIRFRIKADTSVARVSDGNAEWSKTCWRGTHFRPDPDSLSFYRRNPWLNHSWNLSLSPLLLFSFRWNIGIFRSVGIIIVYHRRYIFAFLFQQLCHNAVV